MKGKITTAGSAACGYGTEFLREFQKGDGLLVGKEEVKIISVESHTVLFLDRPFPEDIKTPSPYGRARHERTETWQEGNKD